MSNPLHRYTNSDKAEVLQICIAANNTRRHSKYGTINIVSKDLKKETYIKVWLKDDFLTTLMKLRLGFPCWTVLTFWNTSGGYLTQTFNSQTLRGDL